MKRVLNLAIVISLLSSQANATALPTADQFRLRGLDKPRVSDAETALQALDALNEEMLEAQERHNNFKNTSGWAAYAAKMTVTFGEGNLELPKNVPGLGGGIAVAAESARLIIDEIQRKAVENSDNAFQDLTEKHMSLYLAKTSQDKLNKLLDQVSVNPEKALETLNQTTGILNSKAYNGMDEKRKIAFQNLAIQKMAHDVAANQLQTEEDINTLQVEVAAVDSKATAAVNLSYEVYKSTMGNMDTLMTANENIFNKVSGFEKKVDNYHAQNMGAHDRSHGFLDRMEDFQLSKMSPEEQLSALKEKGWRPDLEGPNREMAISELEVKVEIRANYKMITDGLETMTGNLESLSLIANTLGVDPNIGKTISDAARIGSAAMSAVTSFASGNYLGAVASVVGLFGSKKDAGAERHKQIMAAFGKVFENQKAMMERLDQLAKGQQQIMKNQKTILEAISSLSEQSHMQYVSLNNQLADIRELVLVNQELNMAINQRYINECFSFLPRDMDTGRYVPLESMDYPLFSKLIQDRGSYFSSCQKGLSEMVPPYLEFENLNPYFFLTSYQYQGDTVSNHIRYIHQPVMEYHIENGEDKGATLRSAHELSKPLNVGAVVRLADALVQLHAYFQMLGDDADSPEGALHRPQAISLDYLKTNGPVQRETGREHLESMLKIVDAAILQQKMLSGFGVLPQIQEDLFGTDPERQAMAGNALANNKVLRENLVASSIQANLKKVHMGVRTYAQTYKSKNSPIIQEFLVGTPWRVEKGDNDKWKVVMGIVHDYPGSQDGPQTKGIDVYLPHPELIEAGELNYNPEFHSLVKVRNSIVDQILQYEIWQGKEDFMKKLYLQAI